MEKRKLGNSAVSASVITFGAWAIGGWMWGGANRKDAIDAIRASIDLGVTSIDTAPVYGQGTSEEIVGEALMGIPRPQVQILTKFGMRWDLPKGDLAMQSKDNNGNPIDIYKYAGKESIIKECENSLRRLRTDYIDLYQIHWPDVTTPIAETMEAVEKLRESGKILAAGVCNYNAEQMREAEKTINLASNQVPYSMINRAIENELLPYCIENGKSIIAYSPLQRGLLTGKIQPGHEFNEGDTRRGNRYYTDENIKRTNELLDSLKPVADSHHCTMAQLVLCWTVARPGVTIALVGARDAAQAIQNAKAADVSLDSSEIQFMNEKIENFRLAALDPAK